MARKPTDTTAIEDKATEDKAVTAPDSEVQEQTTGTRDAAPVIQENAVPPVAATEAGTARSASDQLPTDIKTFDYNAISVTGPKKGRWRAGRHFGAEPVIIPLDEVSEDMAQKLQGDPMLSITPCLIDAPVTGD